MKASCLSVGPYSGNCNSRRRDLDLGSLRDRTMLEIKRYLYDTASFLKRNDAECPAMLAT